MVEGVKTVEQTCYDYARRFGGKLPPKSSLVYLSNVTMLVFEAKLNGTQQQYTALDEAIRTARFIRNSCVKYWMEKEGIGRYDLSKYCAILAADDKFPWARKLNSMARQASAERAWSAISRFYDNCKKKVTGKKAESLRSGSPTMQKTQAGFPQFKKHQTHGSAEYKTSVRFV